MNKKTLKVISLFLCLFLMFSICGCKDKPTEEEIYYEYEYEGGSSMNNVGNESIESKNPNSPLSSENSSAAQGQADTSSVGQVPTNTTLPFTFEEYLHKSITISIYDSSCTTYGFAWNSIGKPIKPVLKISKGSTFNESNCKEYAVNVEMCETYISETDTTYYYVSKAVVSGLEPNTEYSYQICDSVAKVYSVAATFKTANPSDSSFTFLHFADSQVNGSKDGESLGKDTGIAFGNTLAAATANCPSSAFMLHTGDIVEWSKYEGYWENMLDFNKKYFNKYIFATISGNHETTYRNGKNEIYKHFNIKTDSQTTTKGFYYYFDYGNARFIMLNTNDLTSDKKLKADQMAWLAEVLSNNPKKWTIVSMHNPLYSPGKYGDSPDWNSVCLALRNQLSNLFAEYNVDLVLQGHDHVYSRTHPIDQNGNTIPNAPTNTVNGVTYYTNPGGTIYAMHGTSGTQTRGVVGNYTAAHYSYTKTSLTNSWAEISVDNEKLTVKVFSAEKGSADLIYSYGIMK